jgi:primosomal protein N' (replication factor Y) (superfamily II helicase)
MSSLILRIAVPSPLPQTFDYLPPPQCAPEQLRPGVRVCVPFGRSRSIGILLALGTDSVWPAARLKAAIEVLDDAPLLAAEQLELAQWASQYYHYPIGEVLAAMLPVLLRQGQAAHLESLRSWHLTSAGEAVDPATLSRAPRQAALLALLRSHPQGVLPEMLATEPDACRATLRTCSAKGWIEERRFFPQATQTVAAAPQLNDAQQAAVTAVTDAFDRFQAFLLDGVTGSGKTEVYLRLIEQVMQRGRQVLVLVPEIALTPQLIGRFQERLGVPLAVLHSHLSEGARLQAWLQARAGLAPVVIGTRSALFTPLAAPGLIIIDEEHDLSYKQQDGFRYHARDLALLRAKRCAIPVLLGSATPALETLYNVQQGRYQPLHLPERAGGAVHPSFELLDVRQRHLQHGLSAPLLEHLETCLQGGGQALVFLNRRGYAPTLLCHDCGWVAQCRRCDARLVMHYGQRLLCCHHCGAQRPIDTQCPECHSTELRALGQGTERLEQVLAERFPGVEQVRIDRDSTRRKGSLETLLEQVHSGRARLLIGTQMLAKGHHFPEVSLAAILDVDYGLFGADFRAAERMAQLIVQVAGRAGRADRPGHVVMQTHHPDHPLLRLLITEGYPAFAAAALAERRAAQLPPYTSLALLRAEAADATAPQAFLEQARELVGRDTGVEVFGPMAAPMARRAGRHRAQLLLQATQRSALQRLLNDWTPQLAALKLSRKVRWSLDVDPMEVL